MEIGGHKERERVAWAQLHALRLPASCVEDIQRHGGAQGFLAQPRDRIFQYLSGARSRRSNQELPGEYESENHRKALRNFLGTGGMILGGQERAELGKLGDTAGAPLCVYARGNPELVFRRPLVAIVGTRRPTSHGLETAFHLARTLGDEGCVVVSGGARGIDFAAHRGALSSKGKTIFVLGEPVHKKRDERSGRIRKLLTAQPATSWLSLTPHGPATRMNRSLFISRNRVLVALSDAVVVVQGYEKSGTLYTAQIARRLKVPLWAIPGPSEAEWARVPNQLIDIGWAQPWCGLGAMLAKKNAQTPKGSPPFAPPFLPELAIEFDTGDSHSEKPAGMRCDGDDPFSEPAEHPFREPVIAEHLGAFWKFLQQQGGSTRFDALADNLQLPAQTILQYALELELKGHIIRNAGMIHVCQK